jgi:hypothetical protein
MKTLAILSAVVLNVTIMHITYASWLCHDNQHMVDLLRFLLMNLVVPIGGVGVILLDIFLVLFFIKSRK